MVSHSVVHKHSSSLQSEANRTAEDTKMAEDYEIKEEQIANANETYSNDSCEQEQNPGEKKKQYNTLQVLAERKLRRQRIRNSVKFIEQVETAYKV